MNKIELTEKIIAIRKEYNSFINGWKQFHDSVGFTNNQTLIHDTAVNARSWWGKVLGILGNDYPYSESFKPESKIIEPLADDSEVIWIIIPENEIEVIKKQRVQVSKEISDIIKFIDNTDDDFFGENTSTKTIFTLNGLFISLNNYSIALGLRLGEIRDTELKINSHTTEG
jgi:hypothetical protein